MPRVKAVWAEKPKYKSINDNLYNSAKWRRFSLKFRRENPLCAECLKRNKFISGNVTDHIIAISMGGAVWDMRNLQTLCRVCDQKKRSAESRGVIFPHEGIFGNYIPRGGV
jgi:5-methylcytosine-specific restriction endonuclease McrA